MPTNSIVSELHLRAPEPMADATSCEAAIQFMMQRLDGFARRLGLDKAAARQIVEQVAAEMPEQVGEEHLIEARHRMIMA